MKTYHHSIVHIYSTDIPTYDRVSLNNFIISVHKDPLYSSY
ncbi:hypothetical protein YPPY53_1932, partial [Yersinia pestis PY-53]